jgi:hypothetical protein
MPHRFHFGKMDPQSSEVLMTYLTAADRLDLRQKLSAAMDPAQDFANLVQQGRYGIDLRVGPDQKRLHVNYEPERPDPKDPTSFDLIVTALRRL